MTGDTEFKAERSALIAATGAVTATYFYFLLFAELALLELLQPLTAGADWRVRGLMVALGLGGVAGSGLAAWRYHVVQWQKQLSWGLRGCAVTGAIALMTGSWGMALAVAGLTGVSLGWVTVILVSGLRSAVGTARLGLVIGVGTGLAYALCNVPFIFEAVPRVQAVMAALVVGAASVATPFLEPQEPSVSVERDYRIMGFGRWVVMLLLLVWLDSAAFYVIQHESALQAATWAGFARLLANAVVYLTFAVGAGWWLDRGGRIALPMSAFVLLAVGCLLLGTKHAVVPASLFHAAGVSLYSVVLGYYPARGGRPTQAAVVYGVAGWGGSALGIGMAQQLATVPGWFLVLAGSVIGVMAAWRGLVQRGAVAAVAGVAVVFLATGDRVEAAEVDATSDLQTRQGREG